MSPARAWVVLLVLAAAPATAQRNPLEAIDRCIARLDPALDVGYARIVARCPSLAHSLEQSAWAQWLPRGWNEAHNDLSAEGLVELRALAARELQVPAAVRRPRVDRLNEILARLDPTSRHQQGALGRFRAWLRAVIERNKQADSGSWLDKMIQSQGRSQFFFDLLTYAALGAMLLLTGIVVWNEVRSAGLLKTRRRAALLAARLDVSPRMRLNWSDVEQAAAMDKPRLVLELVIAKLIELHRAPPAGALTVRELSRAVQLPDAADRERLTQLVLAAERTRYAAMPPPADRIDAVVRQGRELLQRLETQP
jgi:hypothetical protein